MKTIIILIVVTVFGGVSLSQGLNDVCSPSIFNVFAVGNSGVFLKSTNVGASYTTAVISDVDLNSVFSAGQKIWAAGDNGKLYISTNLAVGWNETSVIPGIDLNGVCFTDTSTGFVCGNGGRIFRSTDGGLSWTSINTGISFDLKGFKFAGANTGYSFGESSTLLKTTDGGLSWSQISLPFLGKVRSLDCSGNEIIAGANSGVLLRSTDSGQNWTVIKLNIESLPAVISLKIMSPQNYFLALESSAIWKTTNGGATFTISRNDYRDEISSVAFFESRMYEAGKNYNVIARSVNAGESFDLTSLTSYSVNFVQILSDNLMSLNKTLCMNYQARGVLYSLHKNRLYRTLNMGQNWTVLSEFPVDPEIRRSTQLVVNMKDS